MHRKALALRRELAAAAGADVETRLDVARSLQDGGPCCWTRRATRRGRWRRSRSNGTWPSGWRRRHPATRSGPSWPASHHSIGLLLSQTGKPAEALVAYEKALAIRQKLADANPAVTEFQSDLAWSHNNIGTLLSQTGKPAEALAAYRKALAIRQKLADANPAVTQFQSDLAVEPQQHRPAAVADGEAGGGAGRRTGRRWPSSRSWPTPTPPSPTSRATWPGATTTSASC